MEIESPFDNSPTCEKLNFNYRASCFSTTLKSQESEAGSQTDTKTDSLELCHLNSNHSNDSEQADHEESHDQNCKRFTPKIIIPLSSKNPSKKVSVSRSDCIRKRIKTHFNQYLLKTLNSEISKHFQELSLGKLSQKFIADVKIETNKIFINLPLSDIFTTEFKGSKNFTNNKFVIEKILGSEFSDLKSTISKPYHRYFEYYLKSECFAKDLEKFNKKEGKDYCLLVRKFSLDFIDYYTHEIPYKRRTCEDL